MADTSNDEQTNDEQTNDEQPTEVEPAVLVEETEPATIKRGGQVKTVDFKYAYEKSDMVQLQKRLLWPGTYDVVSHKDDLLHVRGRGRDAWVHASSSDIPLS